MSRWMIKEPVLSEYLAACREADILNIQDNKVLMRMFNTRENYWAHFENITRHFSPLDGLRICEIGAGYGALAKMILEAYNKVCYDIIDLPEVAALAKRYEPWVNAYTEPTGNDYDLVISNYALSEIVDNKDYIDKVLRRSKHGYITCNTDFIGLDWEHKRYPDIKGERKENYILVW